MHTKKKVSDSIHRVGKNAIISRHGNPLVRDTFLINSKEMLVGVMRERQKHQNIMMEGQKLISIISKLLMIVHN